MATVLVFGADGVVGTPLVRTLAGRHRVFACDLMHSKTPERAKGWTIRCDVREWRQVVNAVEIAGPDVIVNLAAEFGRLNGQEFYEQLWSTNCVGMRNVIDVAQRAGARVVHASTSEVYGEPTRTRHRPRHGEEPLAEVLADEVALFPKNDYAISKLANELQLRNADDLRWTCVRLFNAYGPGEWYTPRRSAVTQFIYRMLNGFPVTIYQNCTRDFLYIDDLVHALVAVIETPAGLDRAFINVGGAETCTIGVLARMIAAEIERQTGAYPENPRTWTWEETEPGNSVHKTPCNDRIDDLLGVGWRKTNLGAGLAKTVEWQIQQYGVNADACSRG